MIQNYMTGEYVWTSSKVSLFVIECGHFTSVVCLSFSSFTVFWKCSYGIFFYKNDMKNAKLYCNDCLLI